MKSKMQVVQGKTKELQVLEKEYDSALETMQRMANILGSCLGRIQSQINFQAIHTRVIEPALPKYLTYRVHDKLQDMLRMLKNYKKEIDKIHSDLFTNYQQILQLKSYVQNFLNDIIYTENFYAFKRNNLLEKAASCQKQREQNFEKNQEKLITFGFEKEQLNKKSPGNYPDITYSYYNRQAERVENQMEQNRERNEEQFERVLKKMRPYLEVEEGKKIIDTIFKIIRMQFTKRKKSSGSKNESLLSLEIEQYETSANNMNEY